MKPNLDDLLKNIQAGKGPALVLLFGDDWQVESACKSLVDLLVPQQQREFNLERFDGRSAEWDRIESSLMTPPFLPGKKLVWVENAPYFFSRDNKGEFGEKVLQLWTDGKKDDAAKLLLDFLGLEGWTHEQWQQLDPRSSAEPLIDLLGAEDQDSREAAHALILHSKSKGFELTQRRGSEDHRLLELLEQGVPSWIFLLLTAAQVDRRTRTYKQLEDKGAVLFLGLERDRYGKVSRDGLREFIDLQLKQSGKTIEPKARELILLRAGDELRTLKQELEKLLLYVGERAAIRSQDVETMFVDQTEGWIFDLTRHIAARDAAAALGQVGRLIGQGDHPLKLLGTIAAEIRKLLSARQLMESELRGRWRRGMTYNQFQQAVVSRLPGLLTRNPYADYMCFQRAETFSLQELLWYLQDIHAADLRLKSTGNNPQIVVERLVLHMCMETRRVKSFAPGTTAL